MRWRMVGNLERAFEEMNTQATFAETSLPTSGLLARSNFR
jgi:hypothetical protein